MSDFQQKDGSGILFKNDRKSKDSQPDRVGSVTINGTRYSIAGWIKDGKKGPYLSLAVKPWEDNAARNQPVKPERAPARDVSADDDFGDSIPF